MSQAPIMPFYTDSYLADCHHLSTEAHGAFLLILLHTWRLGGKALPDDDTVMMPVVKARTLPKWRKLKAELRPFFDFTDGTWRQKKLERTWELVNQKISIKRDNAKRGHESRRDANPLKDNNQGGATAIATAVQSINHKPKPNPKPTNTPKEDEKMMSISKPHVSRGALDAIKPLLYESRYYAHRTEYRASPSLLPQIESALEEIEVQLIPAPLDRIQQIVMRLTLHFPVGFGQNKDEVVADYAQMLSDYPEDLICAAYHHVLKNHKYNSLPKIADLIGFMEPEMTLRRTTQRKLTILQQQASEGVNA